MKKIWMIIVVVVVLGLVYFVMQSRPESEAPTSGMPVPGSLINDTEVNSNMPVPGSDVPEMIVE